MTNEEAIKHIRDVICENNTIKPNMAVFESEKEALYMAIEALQKRKTGKLIIIPSSFYKDERISICPFCAERDKFELWHFNGETIFPTPKYCYNCGAKFEGIDTETYRDKYPNYVIDCIRKKKMEVEEWVRLN